MAAHRRRWWHRTPKPAPAVESEPVESDAVTEPELDFTGTWFSEFQQRQDKFEDKRPQAFEWRPYVGRFQVATCPPPPMPEGGTP